MEIVNPVYFKSRTKLFAPRKAYKDFNSEELRNNFLKSLDSDEDGDDEKGDSDKKNSTPKLKPITGKVRKLKVSFFFNYFRSFCFVKFQSFCEISTAKTCAIQGATSELTP